MASKITILRASSLNDLEKQINSFLEQWVSDPRVEVDLIGGITYASYEEARGKYLAPMRLNAPHKRTFDDTEEQKEKLVELAAWLILVPTLLPALTCIFHYYTSHGLFRHYGPWS